MNKLILLATLIVSCLLSSGQDKYFEGTLVYNATVKSKSPTLDDDDARKLFAHGPTCTITIKNGHYRESDGLVEIYSDPKGKKVYFKFKKLDTLYYQDYSSDTSQVTDIVKNDAIQHVNGQECKSITITTANAVHRYAYSTSLRSNPEYDLDNSIGHFNVYSRETAGAIWLMERSEYKFVTVVDSCIRIEPTPVDDHVFDLPNLPVKKFDPALAFLSPRFKGKEDAWMKYLRSNLNTELATKYINLPKGQQMASQTAEMSFMVAADGSVTDIQVLNKGAVHPKLAAEAIRVIRESTGWLPASIYGEKMKFECKQKISFQVQR